MNPSSTNFSPPNTSNHTSLDFNGQWSQGQERQLCFVEPAPPSAITSSDILSDFFDKLKRNVHIDENTPIPPFNFGINLLSLLKGSSNRNYSLLRVLKEIKREIRVGTSEATITFQDRHLPSFLDRSDYFHQLFKGAGISLPLPTGQLIDLKYALSTPECLVTVASESDLEKILKCLENSFRISSKRENNEIIIPFISQDSRKVNIRVVLQGAPRVQELSLDISRFLEDSRQPSPLVMNSHQGWDGIICLLTARTKEENWLKLIQDYTQGKRTLLEKDEAIASKLFLSSFSNESKGATYAAKFLEEFPPKIIPDGNTLVTLALQFAISSHLSNENAELFFRSVNEHLKNLKPITDPSLKKIMLCLRKSISFSDIQSLLELSALRTSIEGPGKFYTSFIQSAEKECLQMQLKTSGQTLLLPFNPEIALKNFQVACNKLSHSKEFHDLYEQLMFSFTGKNSKSPQMDFLESHPKYINFQIALNLINEQNSPMLSHLFLVSMAETSNEITLVNGFLDIFHPPFHANFLNALKNHTSPLISQLSTSIGNLQDNAKKTKAAVFTQLLSEENQETKLFAYDLWISRANETKYLEDELLEAGYILLNAFVTQHKWTQSLNLLRVLSKKSSKEEERLLIVHLEIYKALDSCEDQTERKALTHKLSIQVKNTLTNHTFNRTQFPDLPQKVSSSLSKMILNAIDQNDMHLASDLFLQVSAGKLFDDESLEIKKLGSKVFAGMMKNHDLTPMFSAFFLQFLVENHLWNTDSDLKELLTLANSLANSQYIESIPLFSFTLKQLESSNLSVEEKEHCKILSKKLLEKVISLLNKKHNQEEKLDPVIHRYLIDHHDSLIRKSIHHPESGFATNFILALQPFIEQNSWNTQLIRFVLSDKAPIATRHSLNAMVSSALDNWLTNPKEEEGQDFIKLMKNYKELTSSQIEKIMGIVSSFKNPILKRQALEVWIQINQRKQFSHEQLIKGWKVAIGYPQNTWPNHFIQEIFTFVPWEIDRNTGDLLQNIFQKGLTFFGNRKEIPPHDCIQKMISYTNQPTCKMGKNDASRLYELAVKAHLPIEALELYQRFKTKISSKTIAGAFPDLVILLQSNSIPISDTSIGCLQEMSNSLQVDETFSTKSISALDETPNSQTFKLACSLYAKRLDFLNSRQFRKESLNEYDKVLKALNQSARTTEDHIQLTQLVVHPFALNHTKAAPTIENQCSKLLSSELHEENFCAERTTTVLDTFFDLSKHMDKQSKGFNECFQFAVDLNLKTLQQTDDHESFLVYHQKAIDPLSITLTRLKKLSETKELNNSAKPALEQLDILISAYVDFLRLKKSINLNSETHILKQVVSLFNDILNMHNQSALNKFSSHFVRFTKISFPEYSILEYYHLKTINGLFRSFSEQVQSKKNHDAASFMTALNKRNAAFFADKAFNEEQKISIIKSAFEALLIHTKTVNVTQKRAQKLFERLLYSISSEQPEFKQLLTSASETLQTIIPHIHGARDTFFSETYLCIFNQIPKHKDLKNIDFSQTVFNIAKKIYDSTADLNRFLFLMSQNVHQLDSDQLQSSIEMVKDLMSQKGIHQENLRDWLEELDPIFFNLNSSQKNKFFTFILEVLTDLAENREEKNHDPHSLTQEIFKIKEIILESKSFNILYETLNFLKESSTSSDSPEETKKEQEDFYFQLFIKAYFSDPDKSHSELKNIFNDYFSSQTNILDEHKIDLIKKTFQT